MDNKLLEELLQTKSIKPEKVAGFEALFYFRHTDLSHYIEECAFTHDPENIYEYEVIQHYDINSLLSPLNDRKNFHGIYLQFIQNQNVVRVWNMDAGKSDYDRMEAYKKIPDSYIDELIRQCDIAKKYGYKISGQEIIDAIVSARKESKTHVEQTNPISSTSALQFALNDLTPMEISQEGIEPTESERTDD